MKCVHWSLKLSANARFPTHLAALGGYLGTAQLRPPPTFKHTMKTEDTRGHPTKGGHRDFQHSLMHKGGGRWIISTAMRTCESNKNHVWGPWWCYILLFLKMLFYLALWECMFLDVFRDFSELSLFSFPRSSSLCKLLKPSHDFSHATQWRYEQRQRHWRAARGCTKHSTL